MSTDKQTGTTQVSAAGAVLLNPTLPGFYDDPYAQYAVLRATSPVYREPFTGAWILSRYDTVRRLVKDPTLSVAPDLADKALQVVADAATRDAALGTSGTSKWLLFLDGAAHDRIRRLMVGAFTPRAVAAWQARTEHGVDTLLDQADDCRTIDVIADFALVLPARIISEMLGIPAADLPQLTAWSHDMSRHVEMGRNTPEQFTAIHQATAAMITYMTALVEDRRAHPGEDLLSALLATDATGDQLTTAEAAAQIVMLYSAGHETVANLIGNGLTQLLGAPEQLQHLREDPSLDRPMVEELLRIDSPVQFTRRFATAPVEVEGSTLPQGADILLALGAANRDPDKWGDDADLLDLARPDANEHVSFGGGTHFCLGASLARLEARIALPTLVRRFPQLLACDPTPQWDERLVLRGLTALPVYVHG